jgi:hypothetical protein
MLESRLLPLPIGFGSRPALLVGASENLLGLDSSTANRVFIGEDALAAFASVLGEEKADGTGQQDRHCGDR